MEVVHYNNIVQVLQIPPSLLSNQHFHTNCFNNHLVKHLRSNTGLRL